MSASTIEKKSVAKRYAAALYDIAQEHGVVDGVLGELETMISTVSQHHELKAVLASPLLSRDDGRGLVAKLSEKLKFSSVFRDFLGVLAANGRLALLDVVKEAYLSVLAEKEGRLVAHVTSAQSLKADDLKSLLGALKGRYGDKITVESHVDESLIGGFRVQVGSELLDYSIRSRLNRLRLALN